MTRLLIILTTMKSFNGSRLGEVGGLEALSLNFSTNFK